MIPQSRILILRHFPHKQRLLYGTVQKLRPPEPMAVFCADGPRHIQAVQPHLIRTPVLVPKAPCLIAPETPYMAQQSVKALLISGISRALQQRKQQNSRLNVVQLPRIIPVDLPILVYHGVHPFFDIIKIPLPGPFLPLPLNKQVCPIHPGQKDALMIMKMPLRRQLRRRKPAHHSIACGSRIVQRPHTALANAHSIFPPSFVCVFPFRPLTQFLICSR